MKLEISSSKLVVVSHKQCWPSDESESGFATDGGFPRQMESLSQLFGSTTLVVPCVTCDAAQGSTSLTGKNLSIRRLSALNATGFARRIAFIGWLLANGPRIWQSVWTADAVHVPIPGDVGTLGMLFALLMRKPLFVRHCGNWNAPRTLAERFWRRSMEFFAGGRNVMLATGGSDSPPSSRNREIEWIFSTSLHSAEIGITGPKDLPADGRFRLVIACRQEPRKGTAELIEAFPKVKAKYPLAALDVIGDGSLLENLKHRARSIGVIDSITFHGKVAQASVMQILKNAHVFVYPTSASEGFPKSVLEALASGLPVITTKVSVLPKLIGSECGVLLEDTSVDAITAAVESVCSDTERYEALSGAAIAVARKYTIERWRDEIGRHLVRAWSGESSTEFESVGQNY